MNLLIRDYHKWRNPLVLVLILFSGIAITGCNDNRNNETPAPPSPPPSAGPPVEQIIKNYVQATDTTNSVLRLSVAIRESDGSSRQLRLTMIRRLEPDGRQQMLIQFTEPAEERDRNAIVRILPDGQIEGVRYVQSNDSFAQARGATNEDSLFGMTLQELADGQPEKYDFKFAGEESFEGTAVYRVDGRLKFGAESKFSRLAMLVSRENFTGRTAEFFDNQNTLLRRVIVRKTEKIAERWTRTEWTIENLARGKTLDFKVIDAKYNNKIPDELFTLDHLKKISSR